MPAVKRWPRPKASTSQPSNSLLPSSLSSVSSLTTMTGGSLLVSEVLDEVGGCGTEVMGTAIKDRTAR